MSLTTKFKTNTLITCAALALSTGTAVAESNPFGMSKLNHGYQMAANEAKCGGVKAMPTEGKCGEGKCGGSKPMPSEGKCGGQKQPAEGKCGGK